MIPATYTFKLDDERAASIHVLTHKGREVWIAQEIGAALGYEDPKYFTNKINSEWAERFRAEKDAFKVEGEELADLKRLVGDSPTSGSDPIIHPRTPSLLLLTESGVFLACALAKTEAGDRFRWWLADEVLPSIRRTGSYSAPQAKAQAPTQGELFQVHPLMPLVSPSSPSVAFRVLQAMRTEGVISQRHYHEQLAQLVSRITGLRVELVPPTPNLAHAH